MLAVISCLPTRRGGLGKGVSFIDTNCSFTAKRYVSFSYPFSFFMSLSPSPPPPPPPSLPPLPLPLSLFLLFVVSHLHLSLSLLFLAYYHNLHIYCHVCSPLSLSIFRLISIAENWLQSRSISRTLSDSIKQLANKIKIYTELTCSGLEKRLQ